MESGEEEVGDRELSARGGPSWLEPCKDVVFGNDARFFLPKNDAFRNFYGNLRNGYVN